MLITAIALVLAHEPALANKFETISGGITGSRQLKLDWLASFLYVVGGLSLLSAALAVFTPHNNALFLNFNNWKQSAAILSIIAGICFTSALVI